MNRRRYVLAVLAAAGDGARFTPVHVQKLFFLMDREVSQLTRGPYFQFSPYDYGPFDSGVYDEIERAAREGNAIIDKNGFYRIYALTPAGAALGRRALQEFPPPARSYAAKAAEWVRSLEFHELISSIYARYPDMEVNSVFRR
jgi:hypothetical protein